MWLQTWLQMPRRCLAYPKRRDKNDATGSVLSATRALRLVVPSMLLVTLPLGLLLLLVGCCCCCCCSWSVTGAAALGASLSAACRTVKHLNCSALNNVDQQLHQTFCKVNVRDFAHAPPGACNLRCILGKMAPAVWCWRSVKKAGQEGNWVSRE